MIRSTTLGGILITVALATAGCGAATSQSSRPAQRPTAPPAATPAATQPPSVSQQVSDWFSSGGGNQLKAIATDSATVSTDLQTYAADGMQPADGATLQSDDATFQADIQAAQANLPPVGIPGLRTDYNAALTYDNAEATDLNNAVIAANAGDYTGATTDAQAGITAGNNGNTKLAAANTDVTNYTAP